MLHQTVPDEASAENFEPIEAYVAKGPQVEAHFDLYRVDDNYDVNK